MDYIIRGDYLLTDASLGAQGVLEDGAVYVQGNIIVEVDSYEVLQEAHPQAQVLGGRNHLVMPGLIDAHTHGRGLSFIQRGSDFDFLENSLLDWPGAIDLPPDLNAYLTAARHLRNGVTTLHHNEMGKVSDPQAYQKSSSTLHAYRDIGIRAAYSPGIKDINALACDDEDFFKTLPPALQTFAAPLVFFDKEKAREDYFDWFEGLYQDFNSEMTPIFFGPSWAHGSTDAYLTRIKERSSQLGGLPVHIHTLQTPHQKAYGMKKYGKSLLRHLDDFGLVDSHLTLGHAVYLDQGDIQLLAARKASITHHPSCNLAMRNGIAPVYQLQKAGVNVAIGVDEKGINDDEDAIQELRMAYYLSRVGGGYSLGDTPALSPYEVLAMGSCNGARCLGLEKVGRLAPGMKADVITLDLREITQDPWADPEADIGRLLIHRARGSQVRTVMVDGKVLLEDGKFQSFDLPALYGEVRKAAAKGLSPQQQAYARQMQELKPYYHQWYTGWQDFNREPYSAVNSKI